MDRMVRNDESVSVAVRSANKRLFAKRKAILRWTHKGTVK